MSTPPPPEIPTWPFDGRGTVADGWRPKLKLVNKTVNNESIVTIKPSYTWCLIAACAVPLVVFFVLYFFGPLIPFRSGTRSQAAWLFIAGGVGLLLAGIFFGLVATPFFSLQPILPLLSCNLTTKRLSWHCISHDSPLADITHIDRFYGTVHRRGTLDRHDYVQLRVHTHDGKTHVIWHSEFSFNEDKAAIRQFAELTGISLREHYVDVDQRHPSSRQQPRFFTPKYGKFSDN